MPGTKIGARHRSLRSYIFSGASIPTDVNDAGEIAGYYSVGSQRQGIYWNPSNTPFLMYQRSFVLNDRLLQACQQLGFTPKESGRSGQADFLVALVAAGQGVVLLPSVVARGLVRPGVVRLKLLAPDDLRWDIAFIWRDGAYLSRAAQAWLELLRERPVTASVF